MGGTRFNDVAAAVRIGRAEHDGISGRVLGTLARMGVDARAVPSIRSKSDFGDVDLVASRGQIDRTGEDGIAAALGAIAHDRGDVKDPTFSLLLPGDGGPVQVDVICVGDAMLDFATAQLSYGEASPLSGIVARQMGLKLGLHGLLLTDEDGHGLMRARIDVPHPRALEMIGLDPSAHAAGFDRLEDVFAWIADGRYFDPAVFAYDHMTNRARARAQKRPAYALFLEWMERTRPPARYDWGARGSRTGEWRRRIADLHPEAARGLLDIRENRTSKDAFRTFFTGEAVARATGVADPELRHLMNAVRRDVGTERLRRMADEGDEQGLAREARRIAATDYLPANFDDLASRAVCRR